MYDEEIDEKDIENEAADNENESFLDLLFVNDDEEEENAGPDDFFSWLLS